MQYSVEFQHITKYFPGVKALDDVSFKAYGGEILAFLGENGAGKSTLLKTLNGDYQPSSGNYLLNERNVHFKSPHEAIEAGVSVIYQERQILMELSVAENIYLGRMPVSKWGFTDLKTANEGAEKIIKDFNLKNIKATDKVKDLSIAYQQMVEIMKAYSRDNLNCICFDEPTASLSDSEIDILFNIIKKLKSEGKVIIYVSHRMSEIKSISDKVAIFKDGKFIDIVDSKTTKEKDLIQMMVGRDIGDMFSFMDKDKTFGEAYFKVDNISSDYVRPVSFELHHGEILGFAGLVGAGRTEVMRAIIGADKKISGTVTLNGKEIHNKEPMDAIRNGIVLVPEDRKTQGILQFLDVGDNVAIGSMEENSNKFGILDTRKEESMIQKAIKDFNIKTPNSKKMIKELSGGNQQKVIVGRWMATDPKVLILDEPTKGIDVGAKNEFYHMINDFAKKGLGVILISSELPEVIGLSDKIIIMRNQRVSGIVDAKDATEDMILSYAMSEK
jgi:L-arabinose transport system ATP-binding protein